MLDILVNELNVPSHSSDPNAKIVDTLFRELVQSSPNNFEFLSVIDYLVQDDAQRPKTG